MPHAKPSISGTSVVFARRMARAEEVVLLIEISLHRTDGLAQRVNLHVAHERELTMDIVGPGVVKECLLHCSFVLIACTDKV